MAENKIPVLTEVYQAKPKPVRQDDPTLGITPEFIARVTGHVRPRLEAEITQSIMDTVRNALKKDLLKELQDEITKTQLLIETNTSDFVDRTKADLKTELPRMYQTSADLVQVNLRDKISALQTEAVSKVDAMLSDVMQGAVNAATEQISAHANTLKTDTSDRIQQELHHEMELFQSQSLSKHQAQLGEQLDAISANLNQTAKQDFQQQLGGLHDEALAQMRTNFTEAMPTIYANAVAAEQETITAHISSQLNQEMQAFQTQSLASHQAQLGEQLNNTFETLNQTAKQELEQNLSGLQAEALMQIRTQHSETASQIETLQADAASRLSSLEAEASAQLQANFSAAMPEIYAKAVESEQQNITAHISSQLSQEMQAFHDKSLSEHQTQLGEQLNGVFAALSETAKQSCQQHLAGLQAEAFAQVRKEFNDEVPSIYAAAAQDIKVQFKDEMTAQSASARDHFLTTINADLPAVQEVLRENIQQILATALPDLENNLRKKLTAELQELLLTVKFVLPNN